jgi:hypothetical protein
MDMDQDGGIIPAIAETHINPASRQVKNTDLQSIASATPLVVLPSEWMGGCGTCELLRMGTLERLNTRIKCDDDDY